MVFPKIIEHPISDHIQPSFEYSRLLSVPIQSRYPMAQIEDPGQDFAAVSLAPPPLNIC